jgi:cbb3-type cytochrome oxidase subunit 1
MHWRNRAFVLLALVYALLGGLLGIVWQAAPGALPGHVPRLHGHLMLLGFITMMIYGVGLHVLPRFSGRALYSERLATAQFYLANLGLWLLAAGWLVLRPALALAGGILSFAAMGLFAVNIALTVRSDGPGG